MSAKHALLMIVACVLPMAAVVAVFIFNVQINTVILAAVLLLCPLAHLLMFKNHAGHSHHSSEQTAASAKSPGVETGSI
jgi:uncharacterized membrane protein